VKRPAPAGSPALTDDGQLVSNSSYRDDRLGWLDGGGPVSTGCSKYWPRSWACPAFFRPPRPQDAVDELEATAEA
jgi:hypothetical protein